MVFSIHPFMHKNNYTVGKRGSAFDLGVTNILQESKKLRTVEQSIRPLFDGR